MNKEMISKLIKVIDPGARRCGQYGRVVRVLNTAGWVDVRFQGEDSAYTTRLSSLEVVKEDF